MSRNLDTLPDDSLLKLTFKQGSHSCLKVAPKNTSTMLLDSAR